jgi:hypothetical protein
MVWFPTLVGTAILTVIGVLMMLLVARLTAKGNGHAPSLKRTFLTTVLMSWGLLVMGGNGHGAGILPLPSALTCIMFALAMPSTESFQAIGLFMSQMGLLAFVFVAASKRRRVFAQVVP